MTSTRFTQAVNAGFVFIQLLYLMCQFLPSISLGLILGSGLPTHPLTQYFALKREVSVTVNFGSGEG